MQPSSDYDLLKRREFNYKIHHHIRSLTKSPRLVSLDLEQHSWIRPESLGYVRARNKNPFEKPQIQPNYLSHEEDRRVNRFAGIKIKFFV